MQRARRVGHQVAAVHLEAGVERRRVGRDAVRQRVDRHAAVQVRVLQPRDALAHVGHRPEHRLGVEVVDQRVGELGLDRHRGCEHA